MAKVLLVDTDQGNLGPLREALAAAGHAVAVAPSGSFALTIPAWDRPDVIVSQAQIQDMDGYELCSMIRADPATQKIPFILLTGPMGPIPGAAAQARVDVVIAGSFTVATVVTRVGSLLQRGGGHEVRVVVQEVTQEIVLPDVTRPVVLGASGTDAPGLGGDPGANGRGPDPLLRRGDGAQTLEARARTSGAPETATAPTHGEDRKDA